MIKSFTMKKNFLLNSIKISKKFEKSNELLQYLLFCFV